ncbi:MAG: flavin reductase family protein [Anaerolineales bacterium]|nr:flavin reductase family protein [Anaerolineales bacterium]
MAIDQDQLRMVMRQWSSGVTVVTTHFQGIDHGMTVSSFTSVSLDPPLVTISLMKNSRTHDMVIGSASFGITILSSDQVEISKVFAGQVSDSENRFSGIETIKFITGVPMLKDGLAFFDCNVSKVYDFATNSLIIGEVIAAEVGGKGSPLLYFNQRYHLLQE